MVLGGMDAPALVISINSAHVIFKTRYKLTVDNLIDW